MELSKGRVAAIALLFSALLAASGAQAQVVVSQVYGGGGNSGATLRNDFIELRNNGSDAVSLDGWSVQYASASGSSWQSTPLSGSIAPGSHYLIQEAQGSGGSADLPTPDATGSIAMSGSAGKVALVSATTALSGACPLDQAGVVDLVGFGGASCFEGSAPTAALSNTTAALRNGNGSVDSDDNLADFTVGTPNPRNSGSEPPEPEEPAVERSIAQIQGSGASSPYEGTAVVTEGIVTGRKYNGFFLQTPDSEADADPATSEGVFVFTSAAPSADAAVGNRVRVTGTVVEYVPTSDPVQLPLTEIGGSPSISLVSTGNALPAPVPVTADLTDPAGGFGQLEHLEGMRVSVASLTTVAATEGSSTPYNATGSANGLIYAVVTGLPRPFREPGVQLPDPIPGGAGAQPIPRWDGNPETLTIDSDSLGGTDYLLDLPAGSVIENLTGPLDYGYRRYTVHRDPQVAITVTPGPGPRAARVPDDDEFTVAAYNLERFFDDINDPDADDSVATTAAYQIRLAKASLGIRDYLHAPDVLVAIEVESQPVLQALADRINADAVAAGQDDPQYAAYLLEGNDVGGIDVGFLVKNTPVGAVPRVEVLAVTQLGKDSTWEQPDGSTGTLNDRPPLRLDAIVHPADGRSFPLTVIGVHQRSLIDAELDTDAADRVRKKRQKQAEFLATQLQQIQTDTPDTRLVVLGDFNAYAFNDGLTDVMGVTRGSPATDAETAVPGDGIDLVDPDLINLGEQAPAAERYSYVYDGNAQTLDHVLVNEELVLSTRSTDIDHARINADFSNTARSDASVPTRSADHDPVIAYFSARTVADLAVAVSADATEVPAGASPAWHASVTNLGPEVAEQVGVGFAINAELAGVSVTAPDGWNCDAPQASDGMTSVACVGGDLDNGAQASFAITAPAVQAGSSIELAVAASSPSRDDEADNDRASATVTVIAATPPDLALEISGPLRAASTQPVAYVATVRNLGAWAATAAEIAFVGNSIAPEVVAPAGWECASQGQPAIGVLCTARQAVAAGASVEFAVSLNPQSLLKGRTLRLQGQVAPAQDPVPANNRARIETLLR